MASFVNTFEKYFANGTITTATIGAGPNGELRYPAKLGRRVGVRGRSFQVNDKYALKALQEYANERNCSDWGKSGPHDAGEVNDFGPVSHFFQDNGSWRTDYGQFFLTFYHDQLMKHGERMLQSANRAIREKYSDVALEMRLPNTYWWNHCEFRPAQATSGYPRLPTSLATRTTKPWRCCSETTRTRASKAVNSETSGLQTKTQPTRKLIRRNPCRTSNNKPRREKHVEYTLETGLDPFLRRKLRRL